MKKKNVKSTQGVLDTVKSTLDSKNTTIKQLQKENVRLRKLVWAAHPNFYRRLPHEIHRHIMTFLDQRKLDILCIKTTHFFYFYCKRSLESGLFTISRLGFQTTPNLTFEDVCALFDNSFQRCSWINDGMIISRKKDQMGKEKFHAALLQLGTKRCEKVVQEEEDKEYVMHKMQKKYEKETFLLQLEFVKNVSASQKKPLLQKTRKRKHINEKKKSHKKPFGLFNEKLSKFVFGPDINFMSVDPVSGYFAPSPVPGWNAFTTSHTKSEELKNNDVFIRFTEFVNPAYISAIVIHNGIIVCLGTKFEIGYYLRANQISLKLKRKTRQQKKMAPAMVPRSLFENFDVHVHIFDLIQAKDLPYAEFIACLIETDAGIREESKLNPANFEVIEYPLQQISVMLCSDSEYVFTSVNQNGFTRGMLLYEVAKILQEQREDDEWGDHIYFEGFFLSGHSYHLRLGS